MRYFVIHIILLFNFTFKAQTEYKELDIVFLNLDSLTIVEIDSPNDSTIGWCKLKVDKNSLPNNGKHKYDLVGKFSNERITGNEYYYNQKVELIKIRQLTYNGKNHYLETKILNFRKGKLIAFHIIPHIEENETVINSTYYNNNSISSYYYMDNDSTYSFTINPKQDTINFMQQANVFSSSMSGNSYSFSKNGKKKTVRIYDGYDMYIRVYRNGILIKEKIKTIK